MPKSDQKQQAKCHRAQQERLASEAADKARSKETSPDEAERSSRLGPLATTLVVVVPFMMIGLISPGYFGDGFVLFLIGLIILLIALPIFMLSKK